MASELCMNCFSVKGQFEVCPFCGYVEGTPPAQPHYLTPGTILGRHFIVGTAIGFGGFGITYKCFDSTLGVIVAAKEFYPAGLVNRSPGESRVGLLSGDRKEQYKHQLKRFLMEAQSVAQFGKAKDIVNVYDFFEENGTAYMIMEHIDGVLLKDYLDKQGAMHPDAAMAVIMPIITAVKKIHSKGIVHRDISPDNIFIANEDTIKVFDFGAAKLNDSKEGLEGESVIKVGYSAPEQYRDSAKQGFYTDIYSVGAILYQMLTGIKPIESTEREFKDELKSPLQLGVKISGNMDRAVMEALAIKPELRFQSMQQFEDALKNKWQAEYPAVKIKRRKRRRNWIIASAVLLVMAVGIAIGLYSTILKPENDIFDATIRSSDTQIRIWVENKAQKVWVKSLVNDGFHASEGGNETAQSEGTGDDADKVTKMQEDNEKISEGNVVVEVKPNMEKALKKAKKNPEKNPLPNMFITDHVSNLSDYDLVSLKDSVYEAIDKNDYKFMSEYEEYFPDMEEMPTGLNTLLLYQSYVKYHKDNTLARKDATDTARKETVQKRLEGNLVDIKDLIYRDKSKVIKDETIGNNVLNPRFAVFREEENAAVLSMLLENEEVWNHVLKKKEIPEQADREDMTNILQFNRWVEKKKYLVNPEQYMANQEKKKTDKTDKTDKIYGTTIVSDITFRGRWYDETKTNTEEMGGKNHLDFDYKTYVLEHDEKILVNFSERFAITEDSTNDEKIACERLLWVMLTENGQDKKATDTKNKMTFPILSSKLNKFVDSNRRFGDFISLIENQMNCVLIGDITGAASKFEAGMKKAKIKDDSDLQEYCSQYVSSTE